MNNKCCLCGGRISNGRCVECGMPQQKATGNLDREPQKPQQNIKKTFDKPSVEAGAWKAAEYSTKDAKQKSDAKSFAENTYNKTKMTFSAKSLKPEGKKKGNKFLAIIVMIIAIFGGCAGLIGELVSDYIDDHDNDFTEWVTDDSDTSDYDYDPYEYVEEELPVGEESWTETLGPGFYEVGVNIPAGEYEVTLESGYGSVQMTNKDLTLYVSESMDDQVDDEATEMTLRCYPGSIVEITSQLHVNFSTNTAESLELNGEANDLAETVEYSGDNYGETYVWAGTDFDAGVYDLSSGSDGGYISFEVQSGDSGWTESFEADEEGDVVKNIVIPEGTKVMIYGDVILTPSETIGEDWDNDFYNLLY